MPTPLQKLQNQLQTVKLDAMLVSSVPNISYLTEFSNFSVEEREAFMLVTKLQSYIFTDARYSEAVAEQVTDSLLMELSAQNPLKKSLASIVKKEKISVVGIEEANLTIAEYKTIKNVFPKVKPCSPLVSKLRAIKTPKEIKAIKMASHLGDETFLYLLKQLKAGMTEKQLAVKLEFFIKEHGGDISFRPIVAFGKGSSVPHYQTGNAKLQHGDIVLLDFGVKIDNYCSDMTRTIFFGKASEKQKKMYETVLKAQQKAIDYIQNDCHSEAKPKNSLQNSTNTHKYVMGSSRRYAPQDDIRAADVDQAAREYITSQGYPSIPHSVGHGIGIEVHEFPHLSPQSKDKLQENMVFSIEPGIYLPGFGGVRIEDLVLKTKTGIKLLTHAPKHLIEVF